MALELLLLLLRRSSMRTWCPPRWSNRTPPMNRPTGPPAPTITTSGTVLQWVPGISLGGKFTNRTFMKEEMVPRPVSFH